LVLAPLALKLARQFAPWMETLISAVDNWRILVAATVLIIGLVVSHLWLPDGRRKLYDVIPGIGVTLVAWMAGALMFASYLKEFATYVSTYAGLASIMIALVFLYIIAAIFILGAEINAAILKARERAEMRDRCRDSVVRYRGRVARPCLDFRIRRQSLRFPRG
jgi:membrane protein